MTHPGTPPKRGLINKPRRNTMREKAWKLMRSITGGYTLTEIATLAEAPYENIKHYHQALIAAGYVRQVGARKQEGRGGLDRLYRLVKNTGPKPPVQKDLRFLFDQNTGEYWAENPHQIAREMEAAEPPTLTGPLPPITGKIKLGSGVKLLRPKATTPASGHPSLERRGAKGGTHVA